MDKDFQHDYSKAVTLFVQKMPFELNIAAREIDAYFRECVLYLMSYNEEMRNKPDSGIINRLYTEVPSALSSEQIAHRINDFQSDMKAEVTIPGFFYRMLTIDTASETCNSREFIQLQQEILMLYASSEVTLSFEEGRRITFLCDRLTAMCDQKGIAKATVLESRESNMSQDMIKGLNDQLEKTAKTVSRKNNANYGRLEQATKQGDILEEAKRVEREIDAQLSSQKAEKKNKSVHSNLGSIVQSRLNLSGLPQGKLPNWTKGKNVFSEDKRWDDEDSIAILEESLAKLDKMVGLQSVKGQVQRLVNDIYINRFRPKYSLRNPPIARHIVFSGNPGTGKTTVARILANIYGALGVVSQGQLIEVGRDGLVAEYLGQTEKKTREVIKSALGGVLFIDEAYSLADEDEDQYGRAAITTILKAMEDHYDDFAVIVAGYDDLMQQFINSNPGLKSRFTTKIKFEDYNGEELYEIFESMVHDGDDRLDERAIAAAKMYFNHMYEIRDENFGNGREARNCYARIGPLRSERLVQMYKGRERIEPTKEELQTFTEDDFMSLIILDELEKKQEKERKRKRDETE